MDKKFLYLTYDSVGIETGGGSVTQKESSFLSSLGETVVWDRSSVKETPDPFQQDRQFLKLIQDNAIPSNFYGKLKLCQIYAGCLSESVEELQCMAVKVCYTSAAHDINLSRKAHEELGIPYEFEHINNPVKWKKYLEGYKLADVIVVPSEHSASVMRNFGCTNPIVKIEHGCNLPDLEKVKPLPDHFSVGYLGSCGSPDKGLRYLLEAWKKLAYKDAVLYLAGHDSTSTWVTRLIEHFGGGNIVRLGWMKNVADFYNKISLYCQPSVTEGFGIEILEALSYSRPVVCSRGAGAVDLAPLHSFEAGDVEHLMANIDSYYKNGISSFHQTSNRMQAEQYSWEKIGEKYRGVWNSLLK